MNCEICGTTITEGDTRCGDCWELSSMIQSTGFKVIQKIISKERPRSCYNCEHMVICVVATQFRHWFVYGQALGWKMIDGVKFIESSFLNIVAEYCENFSKEPKSDE